MTSGGSAYAGGELTYDVFLSYAHVNNNPEGGAWVSEFHKKLRAKLDERLGRPGRAKFFFDIETLGKNAEFGPQIEEALSQARASRCSIPRRA